MDWVLGSRRSTSASSICCGVVGLRFRGDVHREDTRVLGDVSWDDVRTFPTAITFCESFPFSILFRLLLLGIGNHAMFYLWPIRLYLLSLFLALLFARPSLTKPAGVSYPLLFIRTLLAHCLRICLRLCLRPLADVCLCYEF